MERSAWRWGCLALVGALLLLLVPGMASLGLWAPDEPRAAAVAREMFAMERGLESLVLLRLNGEAYTQKPPLYYWLVSVASLVPGQVEEWTARLPSALAGVGTLILTLLLGRRLFGPRTALLGAALLLTSYKFVHLSRRAQFDVLLTVFELGALAAFWRIDRGVGNAGRNRIALHACMGIAMLVKGPVGFLIPVLVIAAYLGSERRWRDLRPLFSPLALVFSLGPILAWLAGAVALAPPGFFGEAVGGGVLSRFFEGTSHARPFYYYLYQLPIEFLPWTLLLPAVVVAARRQVFVPGADPDRRRAWRFALAWVGASVAFFSLSSGKRGLYLLPCFPALALLCADALRGLLADRPAPPRALSIGSAAFGALLIAAGLWLAGQDEISGVVPPVMLIVALIGVPLLGALAWNASVRFGRTPAVAAVLLACAFAVEAAVFWSLYPALDAERSMKPVAEAALRWTPAGEPVALLGSRPMIGGLSYYADRPVLWLDDTEEVPAYFASGGRALVMKGSKLERVQRLAPVVVRERLREGDRTLVVVQPEAAERP